MKRFFFWMIVIGIVVGAGAAGFSSFADPRELPASARIEPCRCGAARSRPSSIRAAPCSR